MGRLDNIYRLKARSQLLQAHLLISNIEVLFVGLCVGDHANLKLHLCNAPIAHLRLLPLGFSLLHEGVDQLEQLLAIVPLLANVALQLLVVSVDLGLNVVVDFFDLVAQLGHKGVGFASQLLSVLLKLLKEFETK